MLTIGAGPGASWYCSSIWPETRQKLGKGQAQGLSEYRLAPNSKGLISMLHLAWPGLAPHCLHAGIWRNYELLERQGSDSVHS